MSPSDFQALREQAKGSDKERLTRLEAGMMVLKQRVDVLERKERDRDDDSA